MRDSRMFAGGGRKNARTWMFDWNDLRCYLGVARAGSTIGAAKALGVSQSTVQRRLAVLETQLGVSLAIRRAEGYVLTDQGRALLPLAEQVERAISGFADAAALAAAHEQATIRLTCPEPVAPRLSPLLERFRAQRPQHHIEIVTSDRYLDLRKGEADVAFRSGDTDADLVGRKVADSVWAVYASRAYVDRHGAPGSVGELNDHALATLDATLAGHRVVVWLSKVAPKARIAARSTSVLGLVQAVRSGLGVGPLPVNIADDETDLLQVLPPVPELARTWRLLTTRELRRAPRIAAFFDFIHKERNAVRAILN